MSLVVSHVLQAQLVVMASRPLALGPLGVTVMLLLVKVAPEDILVVAD